MLVKEDQRVLFLMLLPSTCAQHVCMILPCQCYSEGSSVVYGDRHHTLVSDAWVMYGYRQAVSRVDDRQIMKACKFFLFPFHV